MVKRRRNEKCTLERGKNERNCGRKKRNCKEKINPTNNKNEDVKEKENVMRNQGYTGFLFQSAPPY